MEELASRTDFISNIVEDYAETPIVQAKTLSLPEKQDIKNLALIEILIAQPEMNKNLNQNDINTIVNIAAEKYTEKSALPNVYSGSVDTFYESVSEAPETALQATVLAASTTTVTTPKGNSVTVTNNSGITDWSSAEISSLNSQYVSG